MKLKKENNKLIRKRKQQKIGSKEVMQKTKFLLELITNLPGGRSITVKRPVLLVLPPDALALLLAFAVDVDGIGECATGGS